MFRDGCERSLVLPDVAATAEVAEVLLMGRNACVALRARNNQGKTALEEHTEEGRGGVAAGTSV